MSNTPLEQAIAGSALLAGVDAKTLAAVARSVIEESHAKGRQIMGGAAGSIETFRILTQGRVKVVRSDSGNGRELTLWLLGPGDGFDIVSLLDTAPHPVTAWALDEVRTLAAPVSLWHTWIEESPLLRLAVLRYAGSKLRDVADLAVDLALHDTPVRLAHLLLHHFGAGKDNLLRDLPQREIAALIGSVRIVVSRVLAEMGRQGILQLRGGAVRAVDLERLLAQADPDIARAQQPHRLRARGL